MSAIGNKAKNLEWLEKTVGHVPRFLIIDPSTLIRNMDDINIKIGESIHSGNSIASCLESALFDDEELEKVAQKIKTTLNDKIIFRSSGQHEDSSNLSFAGLYESTVETDLDSQKLQSIILHLWKNFYSDRVFAYLRAHSLKPFVEHFSIICQEYFEGQISGVAFLFPSEKKVSLSFTHGSAKNIVDGSNAKHVNLDLVASNSKPELMPVSEKSWQIFQKVLLTISTHKSSAQDIEWSINNDTLALFQIREVTSDINITDDGTVWDNTNIAESYPGITLPLTYSFIKDAYANVYANFFKFAGVSHQRVRENGMVLDNLLGHIQGRVYYNIHNWYKMVALIPGYRYNKVFFEAMLNPERNIANDHKKKSIFGLLMLVPHAIIFLTKIIATPLYSRSFIKRFQRLQSNVEQVEIKKLSFPELVYHYKKVERDFFSEWHVPILNDFRVMIYYGIFKTVVEKVSHSDLERTEFLSLLVTNTSLISVKPLIEISKIASYIKERPRALELINNTELSPIEKYNALIESHKDIEKIIGAYIQQYGDRNPSELKLESLSLKDHPETIVRLIQMYTKVRPINTTQHHDKQTEILDKMRSRVKEKLGIKSIIINPLLSFVLSYARKAIALREEMRLYRSIAFGTARKIFLEIGTRLRNEKYIHEQKDIFYLTKHELFDWMLNHTSITTLQREITDRKKYFSELLTTKPPARRIKTIGLPPSIQIIPVSSKTTDSSRIFTGIASSKGIIRAKVVCMPVFDPNVELGGCILITEQTDPGWMVLFPHIVGLITERGNILSHAAIVSRELGIPSVVAVEDILAHVRTGQEVELNGWTGTITIINTSHE